MLNRGGDSCGIKPYDACIGPYNLIMQHMIIICRHASHRSHTGATQSILISPPYLCTRALCSLAPGAMLLCPIPCTILTLGS